MRRQKIKLLSYKKISKARKANRTVIPCEMRALHVTNSINNGSCHHVSDATSPTSDPRYKLVFELIKVKECTSFVVHLTK
jgi:hypothetical protein